MKHPRYQDNLPRPEAATSTGYRLNAMRAGRGLLSLKTAPEFTFTYEG